ncbi:MAG: AIR synthase family protein [Dehalococcoidia bacterium]|nr:AIR synthase family protein [Dehalococcoidia bacterium]MDD5493614.1 AIR synthase family protein [Dehalococcoidia bacterium]
MLPQLGKLDRATFDKIILSRLGKADKSVIVGPMHGVDAAVVELPDGNVMVIAEDPTFGMPVLMPHFGWAIVHICASDIAVLGVKPKYLTICLMFPPGIKEDVVEGVWKEVDEECKKLGISIIGGHTGMYPGMPYPLNGGCTVIGLGTRKQITPASNAKIGDRVIITKGPAIEATGILACQAEKKLTKKLGKGIVEKAKAYFFEMTVVKDALTAAPLAHAMHDATEGGLLNGVYEIAAASNTGVTLYEDRIVVPDEIGAICKYFNIDPLISISEGTLVLTATPQNSKKIIARLKKNGIKAWDVGEITKSKRLFVRKTGKKEKLEPVAVDPFWAAYFSTLEG